MSYPLEKYKFYTHDNIVVAVSTYAKKRVYGTARCSPNDVFDLDKGKRLAAARCNKKIAKKRFNHAQEKIEEADKRCFEAHKYYDEMRHYFDCAKAEYIEAINECYDLKHLY